MSRGLGDVYKRQEITAPFLLLASDAGSYLNGICIPVDGGHSLGKI